LNHYPQQFQIIRAACHSGRSYAERPTSLVWKSKRYEITEIEREWLEPSQKHFIVRAAMANAPESEKRIHICYDTVEDLWRLCENQ
jgi:hypothetical protein